MKRRNFLRTGAAAAATAGAAAFLGPSSVFAASGASEKKLPQPGHIPKYHDYSQGKTGMDAAKRWVEDFFQPSTLTKEEQMAEMKFLHEAAKPYQGMTISVASETTGNHRFEADIMAKAFEQITGIEVKHDLMGEGESVDKLETEAATGQDIYDLFINDSDFIGTHPRAQDVVPVSDYMTGDGKDITLPNLNVDDYIGKEFVTWPLDGKMYQIPDGQFANLYWYRKDWFDRPDLKKKFKDIYGYELNVPVNWTAYEDIADFFTNKVKHLDGQRVYGHMDYGKKSPSLGWRIHDSWLSMAGMSDKGIPFGHPVDDWGIRVNNYKDLNPVGASVERGGGTNAPAAVYAMEKYAKWLKEYAPPEAAGMTFAEAGPVPAQGQIAQQIFWYTAFASSMTDPDLPVVNSDGTPKWRMAPSPHGAYWEPGMKLGYQDAGSWTLPKATPEKKRAASWLYAQFCMCRTTSLRKTIAALTPFRASDINSKEMGKLAPKLGGLVEFYRSPAAKYWTPTGVNVPAYAKMTSTWWKNIAEINSGQATPQEAMDKVAHGLDEIMHKIELAKLYKVAPPKLNDKKSKEHWFKQPGAPKPKLDDENPPGQTAEYEELLKVFANPESIKNIGKKGGKKS
jgi:glycerol transport system substrate-binding protein